MRKSLVGAAVVGAGIATLTVLTAAPAAADPVPPGCSVYVDYSVGSLYCTAMAPTTTWQARVKCQDLYNGQIFYRFGGIVTGNGGSGAKCINNGHTGAALDVDIVYL